MRFDRYVLREVTTPFFIGLGVYSFVLLMNQLLLYPELFISRGVPLGMVLRLLLDVIPGILAFTVPMSVMMGVLAGLSRLSSDSEITAFKSLGVGHARLLAPLLLFGLAGWAATSYLAQYAAPAANFRFQRTFAEALVQRAETQISPRTFNQPIPGLTIFYRESGPARDWSKVFLVSNESRTGQKIVLAREGRLSVLPEARRAVLRLSDAVEHDVDMNDPAKYPMTFSGRVEEELDGEKLFGDYTAVKRQREMTIGELRRSRLEALARRAEAVRSGNAPARAEAEMDIRRHEVEIHKKYALPFACWIFVFLGLPLGVSTRRGGRAGGFTLSIIIIFLYYVLITAGENMAIKGRVAPWFGMWGADIVFGILGLWLFAASAREIPFPARWPRRRRPAEADESAAAPPVPAVRPRPVLPVFRTLDRYVLRKYLFIAGLALASLAAVSAIITFFEQIDNLYEHGKPIGLLLSYVAFRMPEFIHIGLPVLALMATLLAFGLLTKTNELTAMKACGISVFRAVAPALLMALVLGLLSFYLQERVLPGSNRSAQAVWDELNDAPPRTVAVFHQRWVANRARDRFYHYRYFDPDKAAWSGLQIIDLDVERWTIRRRLYAERAELRDGTIILHNGWTREFRDGIPITYDPFEAEEVPLLDERSLFFTSSKEPSQMTYGELRRHVREIRGLGFDARRPQVDLAVKLAFPWVALIMTLLGLPFAFAMGKRGALVGIAASLGIAVVYWVALGIFKNLGYVGILSASLAAWGPNVLFGLLGGWLFLRVRT
ncbi:MAG: LptF/LptG family permease [Acidobacteriota bacterium]|nr:LptF/LptG family permease [Acidobacteriota bacterium]